MYTDKNISRSLQQGIFPDDLKATFAAPVFKSVANLIVAIVGLF